MRIGPTIGIASNGIDAPNRRGRPVAPVADTPSNRSGTERGDDFGRALAAVAPAEAPPAFVRLRPHAPFITQLIATRDALPETRRLRRAEPALAARAYGRAMTGPGLLTPGYFVDVAR